MSAIGPTSGALESTSSAGVVDARPTDAPRDAASEASHADEAGFLRLLLAQLRPHLGRLTGIALCTLLAGVYSAVLALTLEPLIDNAIVGGDGAALAFGVSILAIFFVIRILGSAGAAVIGAQLSARYLTDTRRAMFAHLQALPMRFHGARSTGDLVAHFSSDLNAIETALVQGVPTALQGIFQSLPALVAMFYLDWRLSTLGLLALPLAALGVRLVGARAERASQEHKIQEGEITAFVQENLMVQPVVKLFGLARREGERFEVEARRLGATTARARRYAGLASTAGSAGLGLVLFLVILGGAFLGRHGELTAGGFVAFLAAFMSFGDALGNLLDAVPPVLQSAGSVHRIDQLLREPLDAIEGDTAPMPALVDAIRLDDVRFAYDPGHPVLDRLSLTIPARSSVALVGPSGSGKSTVLTLLMRFRDPDAGRITADGVDLRRVDVGALRSRMAVVFQESLLLGLSIRENIRLGREGASDEEVERAARAAELHEHVMTLPEGYDTLAGERGANLSGGQRQRLAIARALVSEPDLLLLDEPTSALDPVTEASIQATLRGVARDRTVIAVTHRLASAADADRIFVLEDGHLVEEGAHAELLARGGRYARMWAHQHGFSVAPDGRDAAITPERLEEIELFADLDLDQRRRLADWFVTERFDEGEVVFREGDPADRLYVVARGALEVLIDGRPEPRVRTLRDGDLFGEIALIKGTPRTATIRAMVPTLALSLPRRRVEALFDEAPALRRRFHAIAEDRLGGGA
ncbi:MAG: ABC transporter transmembrane domain-containing protein [Nannocystaceae bacterium]